MKGKIFCRQRLAGLTLWAILIPAVCIHADQDLSRRATWAQPAVEEVKTRVDEWLDSLPPLDERTRRDVDVIWLDSAGSSNADALDKLASTASLLDDAARDLVMACRNEQRPLSLPLFPILKDDTVPDLLRNNLRLLYGRWLVGQQLYDEALQQLESLEPADVVDPAALLFYRSAAYHRLLSKEKGLASIARLLENEPTIPRRYATVAQLMDADLRPLETDSLDEISRLMDNITVRLGHGRAGKRVRTEEEDVVAKLDKLIEQLEQQAQQSSSAGAGGGNNLQPSSPMQDSNPGGGTGPGDVDPKRIGSKSGWGNLPPKERQEALQQLSKEFPSYYREVIEEYFRKLARDDVGQP
jgi:hypothetical protein